MDISRITGAVGCPDLMGIVVGGGCACQPLQIVIVRLKIAAPVNLSKEAKRRGRPPFPLFRGLSPRYIK